MLQRSASRRFRYHGKDCAVHRNFCGSAPPDGLQESCRWGVIFECLSNPPNGPFFGPFFGEVSAFDLTCLSEDELCQSLDAAIKRSTEARNKKVRRFIQAFEDIYKRKPTLDDAEGEFEHQVVQDMHMTLSGARYYLRLAAEHEENEETKNSTE